MVKDLYIDGYDISRIVQEYRHSIETTYDDVITTQDGTEHLFGRKDRDILEITFYPVIPNAVHIQNILSKNVLTVTFNDDSGNLKTGRFRCASGISKSILGYHQNEAVAQYNAVTLRALEVRR